MMNIHPDIAMLRSDTASQHRIEARMRQMQLVWAGNCTVRDAQRDLKRYAEGASLEACPFLYRIFDNHRKAMEFAGDFITAAMSGLSDAPLGEVPFRYRCSSGFSSIQLLQSGEAVINLIAYECRDDAPAEPAQSVLFADCDSVEIVLSGSAIIARHTLNQGPQQSVHITSKRAKLAISDRICLTGLTHSRQIESVEGMMVVLQLSKIPERPGPSREFRLSDSVLLQSASGDKAASQRLMALAVLGSLDAGSAGKHVALRRCALDQAEDLEVRWEAIRQALALDAGQGLNLLNSCTANTADPLSKPARQLRDQLFEREIA